MSKDADSPSDPKPLGETPHVVDNPPPATRANTKREQRALRRMYHQRNAHPWVKKIPWILFPIYGFMRLQDPNHEEHYEQWKEQQRRNYDER
jgi:hypothetical protein